MISKSLYRAYWGIFGCNFPLYYRLIEILMGGSYDNHTGTGEQLTRDRLKLYQPMIWWWVRLVVNSILESLMKGIITCGYAQKPIETLPPGTPPSNTLVQAQVFSILSASGFCDQSFWETNLKVSWILGIRVWPPPVILWRLYPGHMKPASPGSQRYEILWKKTWPGL